jgi:phage portal protein BeeE
MGWWFGRKSAAADVRPFVPAWLKTADDEVGFARSYDAQFEEVYRRNPVGQRAVRLVSGMLGSLTIDVVEGDERAGELVQADGLLESIAANLLLQGNAYVQLIADDRDRPAELCLLRPERVQVLSDDRGWPIGYVYRAGAQMTRYAKADAFGRVQLAHIKALHPTVSTASFTGPIQSPSISPSAFQRACGSRGCAELRSAGRARSCAWPLEWRWRYADGGGLTGFECCAADAAWW